MAKEKILDIIKSSKVIDSAYDIKLNKGQGTNAASATRKDYVDGEIAKQVSKTGDTMTGILKVNAEIQSLSNHSYRQVVGDYGTFWRNDGTNHYLMLTNVGDPYGTWNSFRPLRTELATGKIYLGTDSYVYNDTQKIFHDKYAPRLITHVYNDVGSDLNTIVSAGNVSFDRFSTQAANRPNVVNSANTILNIAGVGATSSSTYGHQLAFSSDGKMYNRYNDNVSWSNWGQVYTTIYRPTPAEVGAVNKTGDTMTGHLKLTSSAVVEVLSSAGNCGVRMSGEGEYAIMRRIPAPEDGIRAGDHIAVWANATTLGKLYFRRARADQTTKYDDYQVYHQGFKPTAADVGAVSKAGDTMTGDLIVDGGADFSQVMIQSRSDDMGLIRISSKAGKTMSAFGSQAGADGLAVRTFISVYDRTTGSYIGDAFAYSHTSDTSAIRGPVSSSAQGAEANALTRKDYVDSEVAKLLARITALESK